MFSKVSVAIPVVFVLAVISTLFWMLGVIAYESSADYSSRPQRLYQISVYSQDGKLFETLERYAPGDVSVIRDRFNTCVQYHAGMSGASSRVIAKYPLEWHVVVKPVGPEK